MLVKRYQVQLSHIIQNDKVHYQIIVTNLNNEKCTKTTTNRYSELKDFHNQLLKNVTLLKLQLQLPQFPGRSIFSQTNKNEERIMQRQVELEMYFNELFSIDKILSLTPVQQYLPIESDTKQQMKISIKIENYVMYDDVVVYSLRFKNNLLNDEWVYKQRYSEIKNIHEALIEQGFKNKLPSFPTRKLFGQTNENPGNTQHIALAQIDLKQLRIQFLQMGNKQIQLLYSTMCQQKIQFIIFKVEFQGLNFQQC